MKDFQWQTVASSKCAYFGEDFLGKITVTADTNYSRLKSQVCDDMKERETEMTVESDEIPLDEMNILEMVDYFMEQGMAEEQANELAHAEWQARDVRQRGNDVVQQEKLDALYAENPIGDDDWFYHHPDRQAFEAVYFNSDSSTGGQYVIMTLPYELISDAVEQTNEVESFFEFLEERASYTELVDIADVDFRATMENYQSHPADLIGRSAEVMNSLITTIANEVEDPVLFSYPNSTGGR